MHKIISIFKEKRGFPLVTIMFLITCQLAHGQKFVIPVLPDTQCEVNFDPQMFTKQIEWIASNRKKLNIPFVLHVGDVVDWDTQDHRMWKQASKTFEILDDAKIPYAIAVGNHDTKAVKEGGSAANPNITNVLLRQTEQFNEYFPVRRFTGQKERFEDNKSDNAAYFFRAGGLDWLVVTLEFCARQQPVNWAKRIIEKYADHNVIILTHYHLTSRGNISQRNAGYGDLSPQNIYDQLIKNYSNIVMVLSGHVQSSALKVDIGENRNKIYQILQNYQGDDNGGGYIRLLEIDPKKGTISGEMYSPYYDRLKNDDSQFELKDVKFLK